MLTLRVFLIALLLFAFAKIGYRQADVRVSSINTAHFYEQPKYIQIPSLKISLPVEVAKIKGDEWLLTDNLTAFYGEKSAFPGQPGMTILFAHAKEGLFAQLPALLENNVIVVQTKTMLYFYQIDEKKIIDPLDTSFLVSEKHKKNKLAVFTCYGVGDRKRIVFFAPLKIVIPISEYKKSYI